MEESVIVEGETVIAAEALLRIAVFTAGITGNEVHNNPTINGRISFLNEGTVFLGSNFFSVITPLDWI